MMVGVHGVAPQKSLIPIGGSLCTDFASTHLGLDDLILCSVLNFRSQQALHKSGSRPLLREIVGRK
jgi:hypothetical protein